ncbi:MAG: hypothetical protein LH650_11515, partial [Chloroflexi bacterium]|nr:hypothetical protein [Chloroflexota bacterium]
GAGCPVGGGGFGGGVVRGARAAYHVPPGARGGPRATAASDPAIVAADAAVPVALGGRLLAEGSTLRRRLDV